MKTIVFVFGCIIVFSFFYLAKGCMELHKVARSECGHWDYSGDMTSSWSSLCSDYITCSSGKSQSPINIDSNNTIIYNTMSGENLECHYFAEERATLMNNGHTLTVFNFSSVSNTLVLPDKTIYTLAQFHFHDQSEHTLDNKIYPLEMHLVHENAEGDLAVLGFFFEEGPESELLDDLIDELEDVAEENGQVEIPLLELQKLIINNISYYHYNGSLTTPPCSENVKWNILTATKEQIEGISKVMGINNRPIQPLNDRIILSYQFNSDNNFVPSTSSASSFSLSFGFMYYTILMSNFLATLVLCILIHHL